MFICRIEDLEEMDVKEGKPANFKIEDAMKTDLSEMDKKILRDIPDKIWKSD